ncbi:MAG TPA: GDYXXLXY domain-containing protein [Verrucomicrobiota bacterium]|nr:hypothetical protein [Verrucomicrobiales bacterium]HRI12142.1 GDYXXLXY domain-containing protein [Verrucomicrobiota bacterium]
MKNKLLFAVVALQCLWVVATVAVQETKLRRATIVRLETRPVDPRDMLRGDYVILSYDISRLSRDLFPQGTDLRSPYSKTVFVKLVRQGPFFVAAAASFEPLTGDSEHPVLRGKVPYSWVPDWQREQANGPSEVAVEYGLEKYFVREGTGNPQGKLTVDVAVPASGQGIIRQVYVDDRPYAEAMRK